jgi:hypothetical protein
MGRKEKPIEDTGPIGRFAQKLRDRRPPGATTRSMAGTTHYSHSAMADACSGRKLPTWDVTHAFLAACGADETEMAEWRQEYDRTRESVGRQLVKVGDAAVVVPTRSSSGLPTREGRLRPVKLDLADPLASIPKPHTVQTFDDLIYQLRVLKIATGNPSLGTVEKGLRDRGTSKSTLSEMMSGRRPPSWDLFGSVVRWLLEQREDSSGSPLTKLAEDWASVEPWRDAWRRAEFNRQRPDLTRPRRTGNIFLADDDQDAGVIASIIAEMSPPEAARLLVTLHKPVAASILSDLPPEKQQAVVNFMWQQVGRGDARPSAPAVDGTVLPYRPKIGQDDLDDGRGGDTHAGA